jgi:glycosyltransferase involved in cell wall biosynthesis
MQIFRSLQKAGLDIELNAANADVYICCDDRNFLTRVSGKYNIALTTHESSELLPNAVENLNMMDEVWTTNKWAQKCFSQYVDSDILVVPVCVDPVFTPSRRVKSDKFFFLHVGEPAPRKNGQMVFEAFVQEFANDPNVTLVFKTYGYHSLSGINSFENIITLDGEMDTESYVNLLSNTHCLVYPTSGEGGGLIPLEAMSTGMPTIATVGTLDYRDYIHLAVDSELGPIPEHILRLESSLKGNIFHPQIDSVRTLMREVYDNYQQYEETYYFQANSLAEEYNWDHITQDRIVPRLREIEKVIR